MLRTMCPKEQQTSDNLIVLLLKYLINAALMLGRVGGWEPLSIINGSVPF